MTGTVRKNLNLCFTKIKRPANPKSSPTRLMNDQSRPFLSTTTTTSILIKNFNSLYDYNTINDSNSKSLIISSESRPEPDFATVFASKRFFFSSPGRSNSIIESSPSIASSTGEDSTESSPSSPPSQSNLLSQINGHDQPKSQSVKDSVAVPTYSPDPYMDFRKSMQEMVEARELHDVKANWEYLHELLLCYLELNPKTAHKYIIGAFSDLLVTLMSSSSTSSEEKKGT